MTDKIVLQTAPTTPMQLLEIACNQGADIANLQQLMELHERWERTEARKAFVAAMNEFKKNPPQILKNSNVSFGNTHYSYSALETVCDAIIAGLSQHGISHSWRPSQTGDLIKVTCILTHELGHSEETSLEAGADTSGSKNPIQALGSAVTYLERYTLLAACGLAAKGTDNDAHATNNGEVAAKIEFIMNSTNLEELKTQYKAAMVQFQGSLAAQRAIVAAKDKRKAQLS